MDSDAPDPAEVEAMKTAMVNMQMQIKQLTTALAKAQVGR
jgi:hypothetical protein